jgi:cytochrome c
MDSFEWNKIIGAVLGTVLFIVALYIGIGGLMEPEKAQKPGMDIAVTETPGGTGEKPVAEAPPDWGTVLPAADVAAGENIHKRCLQCHDFEKGGPNKIGPNLYGIVGNHHAHAPDFAYSAAMKALADKTWDYEALNHFLTDPKVAVPGTKMAFAGLSKTQDRVNVIAFLRTLSDSPVAIPAPNPAAPAKPTEGAAPADGANGDGPAGELQAPPPAEAPGTTKPDAAKPAAPTGTSAPPTPPAAPATPPAAPAATPAPTPSGGGH